MNSDTKPHILKNRVKMGKPEKLKDPKIWVIAVLILTPLTDFSNFYIFDVPQFIESQLIRQFSLNQQEFNSNYTYLYLMSTLAVLFVPKVTNWFSSCLTNLVATWILLLGSIVSFYGIYSDSYFFVIFGRIFVGLGTEICAVGSYLVLEEWFKGGYLTFASSLVNFSGFSAAAISSYTTLPLLTRSRDLQLPYFVSGLMCFGSCIAAFLVYFIDESKTKRKQDYIKKLEEAHSSAVISSTGTKESEGDTLDGFRTEINQFKVRKQPTNIIQKKEEKAEEHVPLSVNIKDISNIRAICLIAQIMINVLYYQFMSLSIEIFQIKFDFSPTMSKNLVAIMSIETLITTPIFGFVIQKLGKKTLFNAISMVLLVASLALFITLPQGTTLIHLPIFLFSQFFSIFNVIIFTMTTLIVPSRSVGMALSLSSLVFSLGFSLYSVITGVIVKKFSRGDFQNVLWFFTATALVGFVLSLVVYYVDRTGDRLLEMKDDDDRVEKLREEMAKSVDGN